MPKLEAIAKDQRAQSAALGAIAAALVLVAGAPDKADPQREDKLVALGEALKAQDRATITRSASSQLDTVTLGAELRKLRDACPACVDLGGGLVEPGAAYTTGVTIAASTKLAAVTDCAGHLEAEGLLCVLDPGAWAVQAVGCQDRDQQTWCEVTVRNTGSKAQRFLALVQTEGP